MNIFNFKLLYLEFLFCFSLLFYRMKDEGGEDPLLRYPGLHEFFEESFFFFRSSNIEKVIEHQDILYIQSDSLTNLTASQKKNIKAKTFILFILFIVLVSFFVQQKINVYNILCEQFQNQNPKKPRTPGGGSSKNQIGTKNQTLELHHIFPKCLGGSSDSKNLIRVSRPKHICLHLTRFLYHLQGFDLLASACLLFEHSNCSGKKANRNQSYSTLKQNLFFCFQSLNDTNCFDNLQNQPLIQKIVYLIQKKDVLYLTPKTYKKLSPNVKNNNKIKCFMLFILLMQVMCHLNAEGINAYDIIVEQIHTSSLNPKNKPARRQVASGQLERHTILSDLDFFEIDVTRELNAILHYIFFLQSPGGCLRLEHLFSAAYLLFPEN